MGNPVALKTSSLSKEHSLLEKVNVTTLPQVKNENMSGAVRLEIP